MAVIRPPQGEGRALTVSSVSAGSVAPATNNGQSARNVAGKLVSIVAPFYNESEGVWLYYEAVRAVAASVPDVRFEFVCVDDGSRDDTLVHLIAATRLDPRFVVVELSRNFGKEAALTAGIDNAIGDAVVPID